MRFQWRANCLLIVAGLLAGAAESALAGDLWGIAEGKTTLSLHSLALDREGLLAAPTGRTESREDAEISILTFTIDASTDLQLVVDDAIINELKGSILHAGGLAVTGPKGELVLEPFVLRVDQTDRSPRTFAVVDVRSGNVPTLIFRNTDVVIDPLSSTLMITSDAVALSPTLATALGRPGLAGQTIASAVVHARLVRLDADQFTEASEGLQSSSVAGVSDCNMLEGTGLIGPDVIVGNLPALNSYGSENGISAFSVATDSCNIGDECLLWIAGTPEHPVIAQNMYRLKDNRFEQIGMSWLKHGFFALTSSLCDSCNAPLVQPGVSPGSRLGVGCSDLYSAGLNGTQSNLGPRSQVNAHTGIFVFPFDRTCSNLQCTVIERRVQVHDVDLDNPGAQYFVEGHYVTPDDAMSGNGNNNASYRPITFVAPGNCFPALDPNEFCAVPTGSTQREQPAIRAWRDTDSSVVETDVQVPGEGLFLLAAKAVNLGNSMWRYEYALQNLNSDRSGGSFSVPIPPGAFVEGIGFHDVDSHSGEPFDLTDWPGIVVDGSVTWSTTSFDVNPNANALRWGTLYNFRFDINVVPDTTMVTLGLFKPGFPVEVTASIIGPAPGLVDCNGNGIADACDIDCGPFGGTCDVAGCGLSDDCNNNGIPDECELETNDCNVNGVVDACDISVADGGFCVEESCSPDCQPNTVPDECELESNDCNANGVPDECDPSVDCDEDGIDDCLDLCPCTSPAEACTCPLDGCCFFPAFPDPLCVGFTQESCEASCGELGCGIWVCNHPPCREGCLLGDFDSDGDLDMEDWGHFVSCFSGTIGEPGFAPPSAECLLRLDFDDDGDVDSMDLGEFVANQTGPTGIRTVCEGLCAECATDLDCDDGNACTVDVCSGIVCSHSPIPDCVPCVVEVPCDDEDFCTGDDACVEGVCLGTPIPGCQPCTIAGGFCSDGNVCTDDVCIGLDCVNTPIDVPVVCNDSNACTNDTCDPATGCVNTPIDVPVVCNDSIVCTTDTCDPVAGCQNTPMTDGTPCDDGNVCTSNDVCDGAGGCSGSLICNDQPELCLVAVPGELPVAGCYGLNEELVVNVVLNLSTAVVAGGQFLIVYAPTVLQVVDVAPGFAQDPNSPFSFELFEAIDDTEGTIFYAVGIDFNEPGEPGTRGPAVMATIRFRPIVSCATIQPLCFLNQPPLTTRLTDINGIAVPFIPCCTNGLAIGGDTPVFNCPDSVALNADAGGITALVTWDTIGASGGCFGDIELVCSAANSFGGNIDHLILAGGEVPTGLSEFTCTASDRCGVSDTCSWTVQINPTNAVDVNVQLSPTMSTGPLRRCIVFEFFSSCVEAPVVVEQTLEFGLPFNLPGRADQVALKIPAGQYACATARDPLHTLRASSGLTIVGTKYVAGFNGDPATGGNWLINGNLNGDGVIDILDNTVLLAQLGSEPDPNTPCGTPGPHADINGDGVVDVLDLSSISVNFLGQDKNLCCPGGTASVAYQPITEISVGELRLMGLSHLRRADLNGDGLVNEADIAVFLEGKVSPKPDRLRPPRKRQQHLR